MSDSFAHQCVEVYNAIKATGSKTKAAALLDIPRTTLRRRYDYCLSTLGMLPLAGFPPVDVPVEPIAIERPRVTFPVIPPDDIGINELLDLMVTRSQKRQEHEAAKDWRKITIDTIEPVVFAFMGDPHMDDDGCDWVQLKNDVALMTLPHVYSINIGDSSNNWIGSLMRLYANQETSSKSARRLIKWLMTGAGINWLLWVIGNHDAWGDGAEILELMNPGHIVMQDWQAKFRVAFANGVEIPIWASHNFKGHSMYNKLHGPLRAALLRGGAEIYVAGHLHTFGIMVDEEPDTGKTFLAIRVSGYKRQDSNAIRNGFPAATKGATVGVVFDPRTRAKIAFEDLASAVRYRDALAVEYAKGATIH